MFTAILCLAMSGIPPTANSTTGVPQESAFRPALGSLLCLDGITNASVAL